MNTYISVNILGSFNIYHLVSLSFSEIELKSTEYCTDADERMQNKCIKYIPKF